MSVEKENMEGILKLIALTIKQRYSFVQEKIKDKG